MSDFNTKSYRLDSWLERNQNKFNKEDFEKLKANANSLTKSQIEHLTDFANGPWIKDPTFACFISIILGWLGLGRFYVKDNFLGVIEFFTGGGFLVLWIYDIFFISKRTKKKNFENVRSIFGAY